MPSFRASVAIGATRAGVAPPAVLEAARNAVIASSCHVEDAFVDVEAVSRGGLPRITIRFVVPTSNDTTEDQDAWSAGKSLAVAVGKVADWRKLQVHRRVKGRWVELRPAP